MNLRLQRSEIMQETPLEKVQWELARERKTFSNHISIRWWRNALDQRGQLLSHLFRYKYFQLFPNRWLIQNTIWCPSTQAPCSFRTAQYNVGLLFCCISLFFAKSIIYSTVLFSLANQIEMRRDDSSLHSNLYDFFFSNFHTRTRMLITWKMSRLSLSIIIHRSLLFALSLLLL